MNFNAALVAMLANEPEPKDPSVDVHASTLPAPADEDSSPEAVAAVLEDTVYRTKAELSEQAVDEQKLIEDFQMPAIEYRKGGERHTLIFQGVCTQCAHCALKLTDSDSIQFGMGPICRKRGGFNGDPAGPSDENQALIDLAEFPELMQLVADRYKPKGARQMMNFLVRICSLNRRSPVHAACTDAIESLGYTQLASVLRESIKVIEISEHKADPNFFVVWVKKSEWSWGWTNGLRALPGARRPTYGSGVKGTLVPKTQKPALWALMKQFYGGFYAKTPKGCIKINPAADKKMADSSPQLSLATSTSN